MEPRFIAAQMRQRGAGGSPPTITSVTPNSASKTGGAVVLAVVGTHLTGATAFFVQDAAHGGSDDGGMLDWQVTDDSHIDTPSGYDASAGTSATGATLIQVTTPFGTATKAFTITA